MCYPSILLRKQQPTSRISTYEQPLGAYISLPPRPDYKIKHPVMWVVIKLSESEVASFWKEELD